MFPIPVLTPAQSAAWDEAAGAVGISTATLMDAAGRAVATLAAQRFGGAIRQGVVVACGTGNNGGDGWVAARVLHRLGVPVWVAALHSSSVNRHSSLCSAMAALARCDGVREISPDGPWPSVGLVVDAVLGTGARGEPRGDAAALIERVAEQALPVVAVDGPSGLDLQDGVAHGPLRARLSVTFGGYKRGHLLARDEVGDLVVADIGFPAPDPGWPLLYTRRRAMGALPALRAGAHKGDRGRVVVVGGDRGLTGAARLAARSAFAAGAGLVHVLLPPDCLPVLAGAEPDIQTRPQPFDAALEEESRALVDRADLVIVGPGLGRHDSRPRLIFEVLERARAAVVDADALTMLQGRVRDVADLATTRSIVLTPHAGEFRTLFPDLAASAAVDPWTAAASAAGTSRCTVLLKGVPTVVAAPDGRGRPPLTVAAGNPGLATGGSGDTLSGLVGTFLAQGLDPQEAAALGAQAMGDGADLAARRHSARSLRPMDVIAAFTELWRAWELERSTLRAFHPPILHELERPAHA